ncbi:DUF349 domain-containing protein [Colwelliaceae bacterium MEBiC 14330]
MIFSTLFKTKAKWQHKDATTRIAAINDELSTTNSEQQAILSMLIKEDGSDLVRRAALIKLACFDRYLEESKTNDQDKIKQFAAKQVHDILSSEHSIVLSAEQKKALLSQESEKPSLTTALLEVWLANEEDSDIMIELYEQISVRKSSTNILLQTFSQKQDAKLQAYLLNKVEDVKVLEKLAKKVCDKDIAEQIFTKISAIEEAIEKPQKLTKKVQLILAKLQALKDVADYGDYKKRRSILIQQWQSLEDDLDILTTEKINAFNEKYQSIMMVLDKLFIAKAENYQQQIIADKLAHDKQQDKKTFTQQLNEISQALTTAVFSSDKLDEAAFKAQLLSLHTAIKNSVLNTSEQSVFIDQLDELSKRLGKIPEIAESVSQATHLISKISQLSLPKSLEELNTRQQTYTDWLKSWHDIEIKTTGILPASIIDAQKEIVNTWQAGLKPLQHKQKETFFQHKKKLQDIKRLLNNGKYKVCFGLFKGVKESISFLSNHQQYQLQRDFDQVSEKLAELSDWEHYIATPRKQELLLSIKALVEKPLDNLNEQAAKVKQYRNTWISLGHADEDIDKQLNNEFNQLCEQAFAPCRSFYAEQDKLREQHLIERQNILTNALQLVEELNQAKASQSIDYKKLDAKLNSLQHQWNTSGEVDRNHYKKLQQQFKNAIAPINEAIRAFQLSNTEQKQALIIKAKALINNDEVFTAIESAKQLQQEWRTIGFAGKKQESALWNEFRSINDQLFALRDQVKSEQQAAQKNQQDIFESQLSNIEVTLNESGSLDNVALEKVKELAQQLLNEVIATKPVIKTVAVRVEALIKKISQLQSNVKASKLKQNWISLFDLLSLQVNQDNCRFSLEQLQASSQFQQLTPFWQKRSQEQIKLSQAVANDTRIDKTLEIEILAQADSPQELAEQRMKVQVQLMQDQMLSASEVDLTDLLVEWLMLGRLSKDEIPLIKRLEKIYCQ